jgi:aldehyde oxidase and xanthine dehydrogenase family protein
MTNEFSSDLHFADMCEAVLIRAKYVGKLKNIIIPELPSGYAFFSAKDIPGEKEIKIFNYTIPVFAFDTVAFVGQPVGILIGSEKSVLVDLRKNFKVLVNIGNATETEAASQSVKYDAAGEKLFDYPVLLKKTFDFGDCKAVFEKANDTVSSCLTFECCYHYRSEPACVKVVHVDDEIYDVYTAAQWPYSVADCVADCLNAPKKNINIHSTNFGEHLNSLVWFPSLLASQCAVAAKLSGKNISLQFSRYEDYNYTTCGPHITVKHKTAISESGKISAMDVTVLIDAGAFSPIIDEVILQILTVASGIYMIPNLHIEVTAYKTQTKPTDFFSGLGESYILNALEKHINEIVFEKSFSPIEFRLQNLNTENTKFGGRILLTECFDFDSLLKAVCKLSDYYRRYYAYKVLNKKMSVNSKNELRGIGLATGLQYSGINSFIKRGVNYSVEMTLTTDGKAIVTVVDCTDDLKKIFAKQISSQLGIDENNIKFIDADEKNFNIIKTMENNILYLTSLIQKCCDAVERMRFRKPLPLTVKKKFQVSKSKDWNPEKLEGVPFVSETGGACVVEVELNPLLYQIKIKNIWLSVAPGAVFHKQAVVQKIKKEIQNCISQLTIENSSTAKFFQYRLLSCADVPNINVTILQSDEKNAIYKGVENIANNLVPAAFASALEQIFIQSDEILFSLPVTQEKIYDTILRIQERQKLETKQSETESVEAAH